jgi:hypothetical protein
LLDSFTEQGIEITRDSFERLLNESHLRYMFKSYRPPLPLEAGALLAKLGNVAPSPTEDWRERVQETITRMSALGAAPTKTQIAEAISPIADAVNEAEETVRRRLGRDAYEIFARIPQESAAAAFEALRAGLVVPIERIVMGYNTETLKVHKEYKLSQDHYADLENILAKHTAPIAGVNREALGRFGIAKYKFYVEQMSAVLAMASEIRSSRIPYGQFAIPYIIRAVTFGPLADLVDPNKVPTEDAELATTTTEAGKSAQSIQTTVRSIANQMRIEKLSYSQVLIREMIEKADEKEKNGIINDFDAMTEDDKRLELIKKKIGIGRWAIGGSKLIYAYNADQYDREREVRLADSANYDSLATGRGEGNATEGRAADPLGVPDYGPNYTENDGGYTYVFHDEADAEDY